MFFSLALREVSDWKRPAPALQVERKGDLAYLQCKLNKHTTGRIIHFKDNMVVYNKNEWMNHWLQQPRVLNIFLPIDFKPPINSQAFCSQLSLSDSAPSGDRGEHRCFYGDRGLMWYCTSVCLTMACSCKALQTLCVAMAIRSGHCQ